MWLRLFMMKKKRMLLLHLTVAGIRLNALSGQEKYGKGKLSQETVKQFVLSF